jgi:hypothetical protein
LFIVRIVVVEDVRWILFEDDDEDEDDWGGRRMLYRPLQRLLH